MTLFYSSKIVVVLIDIYNNLEFIEVHSGHLDFMEVTFK